MSGQTDKWVLVPVEPTGEMVAAAFVGKVEAQSVQHQQRAREVMADNYRAMLSAAPRLAACCVPTPEEDALLAAGDYTPEELWGAGGKPSCPKCFGKPQPPALNKCGACNGCEGPCRLDEESPPALGGEPEVLRGIGSHIDGGLEVFRVHTGEGQIAEMVARANVAPLLAEIGELRSSTIAWRTHHDRIQAERDTLKAEVERIHKDSERLDFILLKCRKVVVERVPGGSEVYVEEGFMSDKTYPSVEVPGEWNNDSVESLQVRRRAIDAALNQAAQAAKDGAQ